MIRLVVLLLMLALPAHAATIMDDTGATLEFSRPFTRIISLYGAHTENLFRMGAGSSVVGISRNDDYPKEVNSLPRLNSKDGMERFLALKPDLVLIRPMHANGYPVLWEGLRKQGVAVIALQPTSLEGMFHYWKKLGQLSGAMDEADGMIREFSDEHTRLLASRPKEQPRIFLESIHRKYATFAYGSLPLVALEAAGGINAASHAQQRRNTAIAYYGKERIVGTGSTIDIYIAQSGTMNRITREDIMNEPGFQVIKAVRDGRVHTVPEHLISRPTMRLLDGMSLLRNIINH